MQSASHPKVRNNDLVLRRLDGDLVVYDMKSFEAHSLSPFAASVFEHSDGTRSVAEIARAIESATQQPVAVEAVEHALDRLAASGLLEAFAPAGRTRRDVLKIAGVAALLIVPLVTTIVAPGAAQAQSMVQVMM